MPYTSKGDKDIKYDYQWYYYGTGWTYFASTYRILNYDNIVQTQWNDKISRPMPDNLLENITALPKQYTRKKFAGSTGDYVYDDSSTSTRSPIWRHEEKYWSVFIPPESSPDTSDWINPLRIKIKEEATNLGTTLAEYRQSVNMFGSAARGLVGAWRTFRGKNPGRRKLTMCDVSAAELIYSYGVSPLLSDVYDSMERLKLRLGYPVFRRYHTRSKDQTFTKWEKKYPLTQSYGSGGYTGWSKWSQSKDIAAYVWFDLEKAQEFILGNPLEIAWELVPYSFVVDWMLPIGDYLMAIDALKAVDTMRVSITEKNVKEHRIYLWGITSAAHSQGVHAARGPGAKPMKFHERSHERTVNTTLPLPTLPKFEISGSYRRLANAVALLHNARKCKGKSPRYSTNSGSIGS